VSILSKLFRRGDNHEEWLVKHPGKESVSVDAPSISATDEAATRSRMESELNEQRTRRDNS
jgi:hypothetical protein